MTVSCHCIWYENREKNWVCSPRAYLNSVSLSVNLFYKDLKPRGGTLVMWTDPQSLKVWMLMVVVVVMTTMMMMMMVNIVLKHAIFSDSLGQRDWRQNSANIENLSSIRSSGKMINWKDDRKVSCFPLLIAIFNTLVCMEFAESCRIGRLRRLCIDHYQTVISFYIKLFGLEPGSSLLMLLFIALLRSTFNRVSVDCYVRISVKL